MIEPPPLKDYSYRSIKKYLELPFFNQLFEDSRSNFSYRIVKYQDSIEIKRYSRSSINYHYWEFSRETNIKETFLNFQKYYRNDYFPQLVNDKYQLL